MATESRVLIIEDDDVLRVMLFTILRHQPLAVDTATTADEAMERTSVCDYALILLDADLPDDDAIEFLRRFEIEHAEATTFIVVVRTAENEPMLHPRVGAVLNKPLEVTFYRSFFAAIALILFLGRRVWGRRWRSTPAFIASVISYGACLTAFVVATKWTTAANAIFLQYAGVIWVLLFSPIVVREPMRARDVVAIVAAMGGMALFFV